jgi:hypothetical protein
MSVGDLVRKAVGRSGSNVEGRDADELLRMLAPRRGPERVLDFMLRSGAYGDGFGTIDGGLSLDRLLANPHGVDLGPLQPRIPECLKTESGMIELAPDAIVADVERLRVSLTEHREGTLVLVGRRDLRSNNSWMHNVEVLVKGKERCTVHVHPDDARRTGVVDGECVVVASATGAVELHAEVTDAVMPGVVSIPHGWGHDARSCASRNADPARTATCSPAPTASTHCRGTPC